jgi:hypothetical protein
MSIRIPAALVLLAALLGAAGGRGSAADGGDGSSPGQVATPAAAAGAKKKKPAPAPGPVAHLVLEQKWFCKEDFAKGLPPKPQWNPALGAWSVVEGWLTGNEVAASHHSSVLFINETALPDAMVMRFDFRLGLAKSISVMGQGVNGVQQRVTFLLDINPNGFCLASMSDNTVMPKEETVWLPRCAQHFDGLTATTMTLEIAGDEALAWTDEQHATYARQPAFAKPRWGVSLRTNGVDLSASFRNVWLTGGVIDPGWDMLRPRFEELMKKAGNR